jgi:hypothetical protein
VIASFYGQHPAAAALDVIGAGLLLASLLRL